jgi:hypothetical protein
MGLTSVPTGTSAKEIAETCGVPARAARRWIARGSMPRTAWITWRIVRYGDLGVISPQWKNWRVIGDKLYTPENWDFRPGEVLAMPIQEQQIRDLKRQLSQPGPVMLPIDWSTGSKPT